MKYSVVVLNYNGARFLPPLLESIFEQTDPAYEVIVVDNHSQDTSLELLKEYPVDQVCALPTNYGISGGLNAGAEKARGEYLTFLGCDQVIPAHYLETFGKMLGPHQIVVGTVIGMDGKIQWAGGYFHGAKPHNFKTIQEAHWSPWATSGAMMLRREDFFHIGGFSSKVRVAEDVEFSLRAWRKGYRIWYSPKVWTWHHGGGTIKTFPKPKQLFDMVYSRHWIAKHYFSGWTQARLVLRDLLFAATQIKHRGCINILDGIILGRIMR